MSAAPARTGNAVELLRLATVGSVDDGKSTLIGRLLVDSQAVCLDHLAALEADSRRLKREGPELAFLTDGLKAEREQGITIDVAYRQFSTPARRFILADTPGHEQYTRNMVTGVSTADLAVLLLDAERGVTTQSKRHGFIASLLGVPHLVLAVNKMDKVAYSESAFQTIVDEYKAFAARLQVASLTWIPLSALRGDNVVHRSDRMPWYGGGSLLEFMETLYIGSGRNLVDFRFPVQLAVRPGPQFRGYAGSVASGVLRVGEEVTALPSGMGARIKTILGPDGEQEYAFPPQAVVLVLDREIDLARGDLLVHPRNRPRAVRDLEAMLIWMHDDPARTDRPYLVKHTTSTVQATFSRMHYRIDPNTLHREATTELGLNEIGRVDVQLARPLLCDEYRRNRTTGGFIVIDPQSNATVGVGLVIERDRDGGSPDIKPATPHAVGSTPAPKAQSGRPVTIWLTGLSGSGKSTLAAALESHLTNAGHRVCLLDGDALRRGLNRDLGFSREDRAENVRRAAEVARLLNAAGLTVIVALISPFRADRAAARTVIGAKSFVEVFVDAPLERCIERDPKGFYAKAKRGEVREYTGISSPYEPPEHPDIRVETGNTGPAECVHQILAQLRDHGVDREAI